MPTFHQIAAKSIRETGESILRLVHATPHDMQAWKPLDNGRTILDQLMECAAMNIVMAQTFTDHKLPPWNYEIYEKLIKDNETTEKMLTAFKDSVEGIASAIEAFSPDHLDDTVILPFGEGVEKTYAELAMMTLSHLGYHNGQMNYIQTLYGDKEMH